MSISLTPQTQAMIEELMRRDGYPSADDIVISALRLLDEQNEPVDDEILAAIEEGEAQIERGEYHDWEKVSAELRAKYLGKLGAKV